MSNEARLNVALDLLQRLPPQDVSENVTLLSKLAPELAGLLIENVDQPLKVGYDERADRKFLLCEYNRDRDSYRSPWTNIYYPPLPDEGGPFPSEKIRDLEEQWNAALDIYRSLYFGEDSVSSSYLWDSAAGFSGVALIKKSIQNEDSTGCWDSVHVFDIQEEANGRSVLYRMTSAVMLWFNATEHNSANYNLGASVTRTLERKGLMNESFAITTLGAMVEELESSIRSQISCLNMNAALSVIDNIRSVQTASELNNKKDLLQSLKAHFGRNTNS